MFPYIYFMIRDFHVAKRDENIGTYAGILGCSLFFGRAISSYFWGTIADTYGRKRVLLIGSIVVVICNTIFGLSVNYWMALASRFSLGLLNGLTGPVKAYCVDICPKEHEAFGLSVFSTAWGVGLILGSAIGGFLAMPAEAFPNTISKESFLGRHPYFLPSFVVSLLGVFACVACYWLQETIHTHKRSAREDQPIEGPEGRRSTLYTLLTNWPLMSSIIVYCIFSIHDMAYSELFPLWAVSDRKHGGLSFTSQKIGVVLAISGFSVLATQLLLYSPFERRFGPVKVARIAGILTLPLLVAYPFISKLSGTILFVTITCASVLKQVLSMTIMTATFVLQNGPVLPEQRGAANGISMTMQSVFKGLGPLTAGSVFSWSQTRLNASFLPGDHLVFFMLSVIEVFALLLTAKQFLRVKVAQSNAATIEPGILMGREPGAARPDQIELEVV